MRRVLEAIPRSRRAAWVGSLAAAALMAGCRVDSLGPKALGARAGSPRLAAAPSGVCPAVGQDTDCGMIITFTDSSVSIVSTGQPPFDGIEDTQVGVVNNSSRPIKAIGLTSALPVFGFDGDGLVAYGVPGNASDPTGYGGPNAFFSDITSDFTGGTVNFLSPLPAGGGVGFFSLEDAIASAYSCQQIVNGAVHPTASGANMDAKFTPNFGLTLQQAGKFCGFTDFDWVQQVTHQDDPSMFFARNLGGAFRPNINGPVNLSSSTTPYSDPPPGGGYTYTAQPDFSYPFYWNVTTELPQQKVGGTTLLFHDAPADGCMPGGSQAGTATCFNKTEPQGAFGGYLTHLAGVNANGSATDLGIGFKWISTYNGHTGGAYIKKTTLPADGDGTGGTTIVAEQTTTNYDYNGIGVSTVNGAPIGSAVPPTITSATASPNVLWPPNNKLVPVALAVVASDGSAAGPTCAITQVTSNETPTFPTEPDWNVTGALALELRASRDGNGTGRVYTITVTCTGATSLSATTNVVVQVPHDQGS